MLLTRAGDYALRGMLNLASLPKDEDAYVAKIAEETSVPSSFLAKIFQNLSKAGLVRSQRGAKGGFVLARTPEEISMLDIIESIEGPMNLNRCLEEEHTCPNSEVCPYHEVFREANQKLKDVFAGYSLQDLVEIKNSKLTAK